MVSLLLEQLTLYNKCYNFFQQTADIEMLEQPTANLREKSIQIELNKISALRTQTTKVSEYKTLRTTLLDYKERFKDLATVGNTMLVRSFWWKGGKKTRAFSHHGLWK